MKSMLKQKGNLVNPKRLTLNAFQSNLSIRCTVNGTFSHKNFFRIFPKKQEPKDHNKTGSEETKKTDSIFDDLNAAEEKAKTEEEKEDMRIRMELNAKPVLEQMEVNKI